MNPTNSINIVLEDLKQGYPGLTPDAGGSLRETAMVCLDSMKHSSGVTCDLKSLREVLAKIGIAWSETVTEQMRNTWYDQREATEMGAAGLAILVILSRTNFTVLRRMDQDEGTGMDYWLATRAAVEELTENFLLKHARLEVAGRRSASVKAIEKLVRDKLKRSRKSDETGTLAYVVVVEFGKPVIFVETRMAEL